MAEELSWLFYFRSNISVLGLVISSLIAADMRKQPEIAFYKLVCYKQTNKQKQQQQ